MARTSALDGSLSAPAQVTGCRDLDHRQVGGTWKHGNVNEPIAVPTPAAPAVDGWSPKLVALDIDGTLLIPDFTTGISADHVSAAVQSAIDAIVAAGVPIVLASGRSPMSMTRVADLIGLTAPGIPRLHIVSSNGAVVVRYPPMELVHERTFDASAAVRLVLEHRPGAAVAVEEHGVGFRVNRHFPPGELDGDITVTDLDDLIADHVSRVIIRDPDATNDDFVALAHRLGLQGTNYYIGYTAWLDIAPEGVSKAQGLQWVVDRLGIDAADVLAIGDGNNDVEMLAWAGRGVAMGHAPAEVKAAANDVTLPVEQDGAAVELRRWFPR